MARGGKRTPDKPAPVSGPGALSQRTDGGAGSDTQPLRTPTGGDYGAAKALTEQQQAAPLPVAGSGGGSATPSPVAGPLPENMALPAAGGVFGPTQYPSRPGTPGAETPAQAVAEDLQGFLRMLYSQFPHPGIASLLNMDNR